MVASHSTAICVVQAWTSGSVPPLRIATWNCRGGASTKWSALEDRGVHVAVLAETTLANPLPDPTLHGPGLTWVSAGENPTKSLAVASRLPLQPLSARDGQGLWAVAAEVPDGPIVLGVWTWFRPGAARRGAYVDSLVATLDSWADEIRSGRVIVAGDFNTGIALGRGPLDAKFSRASETWEAMGLLSAYHHHFDEPVDGPTQATHYFLGHEHRTFHIDYILIPKTKIAAIRGVDVGTYAAWCAPNAAARSDHVPVIVDLDGMQERSAALA